MTISADTKIIADSVILSVQDGREALNEHFGPDLNRVPDREKKFIPVTIHGFITEQWGDDDGDTQEFLVQVKDVTIDLPA